MKVVAILQARCSSTRLPNKILEKILDKAMIQHQLERIQRCKNIEQLVVATSTDESDDKLVDLCEKLNVNIYRGDLNNVLDRFYQTALLYNADIVVRLTGDCPLADPKLIDEVIQLHIKEQNNYTSNTETETFPDGLDVEVFNFLDLKHAWKNAVNTSDLEHVTPYIRNNQMIQKGSYTSEINYSNYRWTVDEQKDLDFVRKIYSTLGEKGEFFGSQDIYNLLTDKPEIMEINANIVRNEGYSKSLEQDKL
jgi:spore coat polysaccharide biosynthesis protein SpsF